jgi:hypothetical protein
MRGGPEQIIERGGACELAAEKIEFLGDACPLPRRDRLGAHARGEIARDERHNREKNKATTFSGSAMVNV